MAKIPYDVVAIESDKILSKILSSKNTDEMYKYYDQYIDYLRAVGWSEEEFDRETSRRVDSNWENKSQAN